MALGRKNVSVARTNGRADIFRLAGLLGDDNLIRHEGLVSRIGSRVSSRTYSELSPLASYRPGGFAPGAAKLWRNAARWCGGPGATEDGPCGTGCESTSFDAAVLSRFRNQN